MMYSRKILAALACVLLASLLTTTVLAQSGIPGPSQVESILTPNIYSIDTEDYGEAELPLLLFSFILSIDAEFFFGYELPVEIQVEYPQWLTRDCPFSVNYSAYGQEGRAGLDIGAGVSLDVKIGDERFTVIDERRELDLSTTYYTPVGNSITRPMSTRIEFEEFSIPYTEIRVAAYLGIEAEFRLEGEITSELEVTGPVVGSPLTYLLLWNGTTDTWMVPLQTMVDAASNVELNMKDTKLVMRSFAIQIAGFYLDLEIPVLGTLRLPIPFPTDLPQAEIPTSFTLDLNTVPLSIPVHVDNEGSWISGWNIPSLLGIAAIAALAVFVIIFLPRSR
ncbi:MAG: hypothetical protein ACFFER_19630 [Candidatus Thorarchaeota archaeon]